MIHYPTCIKMFGPMNRMCCIRYEGKHNFFKKHAHMICNFRNISKSMAFKHQLSQYYYFHKHGGFSDHIEVGNGKIENLSNLPFCNLVHEKIDVPSVFLAKSVTINNILYRRRYLVFVIKCLLKKITCLVLVE